MPLTPTYPFVPSIASRSFSLFVPAFFMALATM